MEPWTARRILRQLCDADRRRAILTAFWEAADPHAQHRALAELAKSLHFRPETLRKSPAAKKGELLASRINAPGFEETFEVALMAYHTREKKEMLAAFLDHWGIPHADGSIEVDDYEPPTSAKVDSAVAELRGRFPVRDIAIYLASAGLLMGSVPGWREPAWAAAEKLAPELAA